MKTPTLHIFDKNIIGTWDGIGSKEMYVPASERKEFNVTILMMNSVDKKKFKRDCKKKI